MAASDATVFSFTSSVAGLTDAFVDHFDSRVILHGRSAAGDFQAAAIGVGLAVGAADGRPIGRTEGRAFGFHGSGGGVDGGSAGTLVG